MLYMEDFVRQQSLKLIIIWLKTKWPKLNKVFGCDWLEEQNTHRNLWKSTILLNPFNEET